MATMELHVWDGEPSWGIPSMDLNSLQMMLYVKFSGAPVTIVKTCSPSSAPTGVLPVFTCSEGAFTDFTAMTTFLRKQNYSCDHDLSGRQCSEVLAYEHLLQEKLFPALTYLWWVEPSSYHEVIHNWFYSHMRFPSKMWVANNKHKASTALMEALVDEPDDPVALETQVLKHAQECLTMISNRLGEREYFFGRSPTAVDAILIAYLTMLLKVDLKKPVLQNHVRACPNLTRYVAKTLQRFFPSEGGSDGSSTKTGARPHGSQTQDPTPDEFPNKGRNLLICALVAIAANLGYAVATGIVQVDMGDSSMIQVDDDYDLEENEE